MFEEVLNNIKEVLTSTPLLKQQDNCYVVELDVDYILRLEDQVLRQAFLKSDPCATLDKLLESWYHNYEENEFRRIKTEIEQFSRNGGWRQQYDDCSDKVDQWLRRNIKFVYINGRAFEHKFNIDIFVDTSGSECTVGNVKRHYGGEPEDPLDASDTLVWLAKTQGYSKEQLRMALHDNAYSKSPFMTSLRAEISNGFINLNSLAFFTKMSLNECFSVKKIHIEKDTPCGLLEPDTGGGSLLSITLEKDLIITDPVLICPDCSLRYPVKGLYNKEDSFWK